MMRKHTTLIILMALQLASSLAWATSAIPHAAPVEQLKSTLVQQSLSEEAFTAIYAAALRNNYPDATITVTAPLEIEAEIDGGGLSIYLGNFWRASAEEPEQRLEYLQRLLAHVEETRRASTASAASATVTVVPVLRHRDYIDAVNAQTGGEIDIAAQQFIGDLWLIYASDSEGQIRFLEWSDIDELGIERDALPAQAVHNLRQILPGVERHGEGPVYMLVADGSYEASLLLLDEIWESQAELVPGALVAAVPNRDILLFTGSGSEEGMEILGQLTRRMHAEEPYPVSEQLLIRQEGHWSQYR